MVEFAYGTGVVLCVIVWSGLYIYWRSTHRVRCPTCGRSVDRMELIVDEPYCCFCADRFATADPLPLVEPECARCGAMVDDSTRINLWDGHSYCESCVADSSSDLMTLARQNHQFEDETPWSVWRVFGLVLLLIDGTLFSLMAAVTVLSGSRIPAASEISLDHLTSFVLAIVALTALAAPPSIVAALMYVHNRPCISVRNGLLTVRFGRRASRTFPLSKCSWFAGSAAWENLLGTFPLSMSRAVVLALPKQLGEHQKYGVVGHTRRKREIWTAFLKLANVPRTHAPWPPRKR